MSRNNLPAPRIDLDWPAALRAWRLKHGLTFRQAALLAGVSRASWEHWEGKNRSPRWQHHRRLAALITTTPDIAGARHQWPHAFR